MYLFLLFQSDLNADINTLETNINELHKRITGVEAKPHTRAYIYEELRKAYQASSNTPTTSLNLDTDEVILTVVVEMNDDRSFFLSVEHLRRFYYSYEIHGKSSVSDHDVYGQVRLRILSIQ